MNYIEILGIIASAIILLSSLFKNLLWLRTCNLIGAVLLCIYGIMISALSVWILNGCMILTQTYQIIKLLKQKQINKRR